MKAPLISVRELTRTYDLGETQVHALRGVSLEVMTAEFVTLTAKASTPGFLVMLPGTTASVDAEASSASRLAFVLSLTASWSSG